MSTIDKPERVTQNRVIDLFRNELGYRYLGDWTDRDGNSNIEEGLLTDYLSRNGYSREQISVALYKLRTEADKHSRSLYGRQPGRLQSNALRRPGKDRGGKGHGNRPPHQLERPSQKRLRHRRRGNPQGQPGASARHRALRQRHSRRRAGAETKLRHHRRRHPPEPFQPAARVQRVVLSALCSSYSQAATQRG